MVTFHGTDASVKIQRPFMRRLARRAIRRADLRTHSNPEFQIDSSDDPVEVYSRFAIDIVTRIVDAGMAGRKCVLILPVGPVPQYAIAAEMINRLGISCRRDG